jgi:hypothetical protein
VAGWGRRRCGAFHPNRRSKPHRPGSLFRGPRGPVMAGTATGHRFAGPGLGPQRWIGSLPIRKERQGRLKRSVHRGRDGANLTNTARGTPWKRRTCGFTDFDRPRCCEALRSAGPSGPLAFRAPSVLFEAAAKMEDGVPGAGKEYGRWRLLAHRRLGQWPIGQCTIGQRPISHWTPGDAMVNPLAYLGLWAPSG